MPKLSREYILPAILAGIAAVLALSLALEWVVLSRDRDEALTLPPAKAAPPTEAGTGNAQDLELPALDEYRQMAERPLFMESRRPGADPTEAVAPPPPMMPMTLKLMGIVHTPEGRKALVVDAKGKYKRLKMQDTLDSWTLVEVEADRVTMQQGDERKELSLLKKKPKPPAPPGQPGQPMQPGQPPRPQARPPIPQPVEEMEEEPADTPEDEDTGVVEEDTGSDE